MIQFKQARLKERTGDIERAKVLFEQTEADAGATGIATARQLACVEAAQFPHRVQRDEEAASKCRELLRNLVLGREDSMAERATALLNQIEAEMVAIEISGVASPSRPSALKSFARPFDVISATARIASRRMRLSYLSPSNVG